MTDVRGFSSEPNPQRFDTGAGAIPPQVFGVLESLSQHLTDAVIPQIFLRLQAEDQIRAEHPNWFIEYPQPRNAKQKIARRGRAGKIESREKKRYYAIEARVKELGGQALGDVVRQTFSPENIQRFSVVDGYASAEQEISYLDQLYEIE